MGVESALWVLLLALAFLPPLVFALFVRNHEKRGREPLHAVLGMFVYGGTLGALLALVLNTVFEVGFVADSGAATASFLTAVFAAPFIEEMAKGLGLKFVRPRILEMEDGIVYGAAVGLGFAATENLLYGFDALATEGVGTAIVTLVMRSLSSMILHAASSALVGFGYGLMVLRGGTIGQLAPYYLLAVGQHALYNFLVYSQGLLGLAAAVVMVFVVMGYLRRRLRALDAAPRDRWSVVR